MNCVEFRRQLGVDPHTRDAEFARHRADCARCADAAARSLGFDRDLARALEVPVPARLTESVLLAQATSQRRRRTQLRRSAFFALAAALVLAVGVNSMRAEALPLSARAVAHLRGEVNALSLTYTLPAVMIRQAFSDRGVTLRRVPEGVSFVYCCPLDKYHTVHLVMPDGDDPVTVMYIVDKQVRLREDFTEQGWNGRIVPLGAGTLVLLARKTGAFDRVEHDWREALGDDARS